MEYSKNQCYSDVRSLDRLQNERGKKCPFAPDRGAKDEVQKNKLQNTPNLPINKWANELDQLFSKEETNGQ